MRHLSIVVIVVSSFFVVGCGSVNGGSSGSGNFAVATHETGQAMMLAQVNGTLEGYSNGDGTACFSLGSQSGQRLTLVWPQGYFAAGQPLSLFDKAAVKVASVGQTVTLAGGRAPLGMSVPTGCTSAQDVWLVGEVIQAK